MLFNDVMRHIQSQSGPLTDGFCREKWIKYPGEIFRGNPLAGIADGNFHMIAGLPGGDVYFTFIFYSMRRIDQQIHEHLIDLLRITIDLWQLTVIFDDGCLVFQLIPDDVQGAVEVMVDIGQLQDIFAGMGEIFEIQNDLFDAIQPFTGFTNQVGDIFQDKRDIQFRLLRLQ